MNNDLLQKLIEQLLSIKTTDSMRNFLEGILTPKELEELPRRLEIIKLLKSGMTQHDISEKLGVGIATVTRGSREIKLGRFESVKETK